MEALRETPVARRRIELVERKGLGHPDTICDALVEAISLALNRMYLAEAGAILHYNIDKALLAAGQCRKGFGWGELTQPMELVVGDRATFEVDGTRLPVEQTARAAVEAWVAARLPHVRPGKDLCVRLVLAPGSAELRRIFEARASEILSNDTCGASGYAPLSPTEQLVLAVERFLNGPEFKAAFPDTGEDVKVFAARQDARVALTVAMPMLCVPTPSERAYFQRKDEVLAALARRFASVPFEIAWRLNTLDRPGRGAEGVYLVLTGTSAEDADSGQVGRGNRANGLIAFSRPTGGEAAPGKNPVAHVGKVYSVLSHRLAQLIHARCPALEEVYVHLAARIGEPVDRPWTGVQVVLPEGLALSDVEAVVADVAEAEIARLPAFRAELARGEHPVC
ncbi:MAG: methionine adenosyltransferase [Candidatus Rokubacteria bacterium]|nr:methionine adenosyltransferase [Candidatus Rokubacteria bacterium]